MILFAKRVAKAIKKTIECRRVGLTVIGLEVPHAHIHLIPITKESDISFGNPKKKLKAKEFAEIASAIAANFS
jgi:histidine triad (HIT) family protein